MLFGFSVNLEKKLRNNGDMVLLGFCSYYRRFVVNFALIAKPLPDLRNEWYIASLEQTVPECN